MEKQFASFETLNAFGKVLEETLVSNAGGAPITLVEGLSVAVQEVEKISQTEKKVIMIGNGGSAAICSHLSTDLWKNGGIRAIAFNDTSLLTCAANDFGYDEVFAQPTSRFADSGDLYIAISSSGKSENILNGVKAARDAGCRVITFSGFKQDNPLRKAGDLNFYLESGSYGVVETGHQLLLHAITDEVIRKAESTQ